MEYKIKTIKAKMPTYWYANRIGEVFNVKDVVYNNEFKIKVLGEVGKFINKEDCEIMKETPEFDMKKEKWFIRVNSKEESIAAQNWLFEQGFGWSGMKVVREDFDNWDKPAAIGFGHMGGNTLGQAFVSYWEHNEHLEVKPSFKTTIYSVKYPVVKTEQDKAIRELEETIAKAAEQIKQLKGI